MCKTRTFGVEVEGYVDRDGVKGSKIGAFEIIDDGSLESEPDECSSCYGDGKQTESCPNCEDGNEECNECEGSGYEECSTCEDMGTVHCTNCTNGFLADNEACDECGGDGLAQCEDCDGRGTVDCEHCGGEAHKECSECEGSGNIRVTCEDCDGSGQSSSGYGVEAVSDILTEDDMDKIDYLFTRLDEMGWHVRDDCGTHVHIGAKDYGAADLSRLMVLMNLIEPIIYSSLPSERYDNNYCKSTRKTMASYLLMKGEDITFDELTELIYGSSRRLDGGFGKYEQERYYGTNLHSWFYRKTVEFRYFEGAESSYDVKAWAELCIKLVDFAKHATFDMLRVIGDSVLRESSMTKQIAIIENVLDLQILNAGSNEGVHERASYNVVSSYKVGSKVAESNMNLRHAL